MNKKSIYVLVAAIVIVVVGVIIYQKIGSGNSSAVALDNKVVSQSDASMLYSIANNDSLANMVGASVSPTKGTVNITGSSILLVDGKPTVVYIGAEYCPYCAVTRWSIILALMRFGNFTNLHYMTSSASDNPASVPGFTFYNSTYSSDTISFMSVETTTNRLDPSTSYYYQLQKLNAIENATFGAFNGGGGSIPFTDFGNVSVQIGAVVNPSILNGMSQPQIIRKMNDPKSVEAQNLIGGANLFTAKICEITNNTPQSVCGQEYVKIIEEYG